MPNQQDTKTYPLPFCIWLCCTEEGRRACLEVGTPLISLTDIHNPLEDDNERPSHSDSR